MRQSSRCRCIRIWIELRRDWLVSVLALMIRSDQATLSAGQWHLGHRAAVAAGRGGRKAEHRRCSGVQPYPIVTPRAVNEPRQREDGWNEECGRSPIGRRLRKLSNGDDRRNNSSTAVATSRNRIIAVQSEST